MADRKQRENGTVAPDPEAQPIAPTSGAPLDPSTFVRSPDGVPPGVREALEETLIGKCHAGFPGPPRGEECLGCTYFRGLIRHHDSGQPHVDFRGLCGVPRRKRLVVGRRVSGVECTEAAAKVEGATRGERINAEHCDGCSWNRELSAAESVCASPLGVRFHPIAVG